MKALTVIMPTFNAARYLERCLSSFKAQTFDDWELLCVDRGSTDGTLEILQAWARDWDKLRILDGGHERTSQINIAVRSSQSEFIYYTASDFDVDPTLLEDAMRAAVTQNADAVWINCVSYGDGFWARVRNLERSTYFGSVKFEGARFFRRTAYERAGGYDDSVPILEEYDLQKRLMESGARFTRITTAVERHLGEPESLAEIWRKHYYYGQQFNNLLRKEGTSALRYGNPMRATFLKHWRDFVRQPVLTGGFIVMLAAKYTAGGLGLANAWLTDLRRQATR